MFALEHLRTLAALTTASLTGDIAALVEAYADSGWRADQAFLEALAATTEHADRVAVTVAALAVYRPWVEANAEALQSAVTSTAGSYTPGDAASTAAGTVTLFIDGFRLDLAHRLAAQLDQFELTIDTSLAALPTVTTTAKPALIPMDDGALVGGKGLGPAKPSGTEAGVTVWRALLEAQGVQVLTGADTGDPNGAAWAEAGDIDKRGHDFGVALVDELDNELRTIAKRIRRMLDAGWRQVDVVTDHGWVLIPGGLPKVDLPVAVTEKKKGRCARLKPGADVSVPTVAWHWDPNVRIAIAPGISCFEQGKEYEHGGISLQECVVPRMHIRASAQRSTTTSATITQIRWSGLRCRVEYDNVAPGATVDVRAMPGEPSSSVAQDPRDTLTTGKAALLVPDEDLEGESAYVVVVASDGTILAQRETTIGRNG